MRITLPGTELTVHPLCLGGNVFGWSTDADGSFAVLDAYAEAGGNFVDTADSYFWRKPGNSGGESEAIIGDWLAARGNRDGMVLATKVGSWPTRPGLARDNITAAVDDSLRRLRTDHIDLYYAHKDDPDTPPEETVAAFDALVTAGKVRYVAASNFTAPRLAESLAISEREGLARYVALQPHYNLMERGYERELAPLLAERGLSCLPYFALAKGFLTGKYRAERSASETSIRTERSASETSIRTEVDSVRSQDAAAYLDDRGRRVLAELDAVAERHRARPATVALAWLAAQPTVSTPIASARTPDQLTDLLAMAELELDHDDLTRLTAASAPDD